MGKSKKQSTRTPEQLSSLERVFFVIGSAVGFMNSAFIGNREVPWEVYFLSVLPILPVTYIMAYNLTLRDSKNSARISALAGGAYFVGEAAHIVTRNYL